MKNFIYSILLIALICVTNNVFGQQTNISGQIDTTKFYKIELNDGSEFIGNILQKDSIYLVIKTSSIPKIELPLKNIKNIVEIDRSKLKQGSYWFQNPHGTRYLYGPSAFNLKKGEGYFQNTYLILNSFNLGITDNISIGGGLEFLSTFSWLATASGGPIFFITPKVGFKVSEMFHAGGGILFVSFQEDWSRRISLGTAYGIVTYGTLEHNLTGGFGWGIYDGVLSDGPIITISGMTRIARRSALVTENWIITTGGYYGVYSYGIRFFGESMAVDLAFINNSEIVNVLLIGIPFVSFVVKF